MDTVVKSKSGYDHGIWFVTRVTRLVPLAE